nr:vitellogenin [Scaphoideus titanus]
MFVGNQGNSIQAAKEINGVAVVKKISYEIGKEVQAASAIPGQKTLEKFTVLSRVLRTMNLKQMEEASKELYFPLSKASSSSFGDTQKHQAWVAFRDAVGQVGTGPALLTIKEWIQSKKVQGNEAAELLSVLPYSARFPNTEYMNAFFALATSSEVQHQQFLNTSALLSFTELARKAFVSNSTAYNRFPVHAFGALRPKREQPVVQQYIPYFAQALKQAVKQEDSIKIRTLTLALGNLAHPRILKVFEPYLEGKEPMTHFQRLTIVVSLNKLAKVYPKVARPVLFRIYQNTGEMTELRVAAVYQLMKTNPPAQLLQRMAQFTNDDQDPQTISAVQSAIKSTAHNMRNPEFHEMRMNAQSAVNLLNPKEMPAHFSKRNMRSYMANELNLAYKQSLSYIGSDDSFLPSNVFYSLRRNMGGLKMKAAGFGAMTSSLDALADLFEDQFADDSSPSSSSGHRNNQQSHQAHHQSSGSDASWSFDKIDKMLNMLNPEQKQVEAQLYLNVMSGKRFFAIDNHTIEMLPQMVKNAAATLRSGKNFNYTKITNRFSMTVAFPTAMGLPFVFSMQTPTMVYIGGQAQAKSHPDLASGNSHEIQVPQTVNASVEMQLVYSTRAQSQMGFVVPFSRMHYVAGVNKNIQFNIPIRAEIDIDTMNNNVTAKVMPLDQNNKQNIFEYSTEPYTAKHNILQMAQNPHEQIHEANNNNRKIVHVRRPNQIHKTVGQDSTGFAFDFDYHSEQKFLDFAAIYNEAHKHRDPVSAIIYAWAEDSINLNNITLAYNPQKSSAKYARFSAAYLDNSDDENNSGHRNSNSDNKNYRNSDRNSDSNSNGNNYDDNQQGSSDNQRASPNDHISANMAKPSSSAPGSQRRQQEFLQKVGRGIQDSDNFVVDVAAEFDGQTNAQYIATIALATSNVSATSRLLFFAEKNPAQSNSNNKHAQMFAAVESSMPNVPLMNYNKALNADPTSYFNAEVAFGEKSSEPARVQFKGKMQQSNTRRQYLEQSPLAQKCKQQMQEGNTVQYACRNVTSQANLLDQYKLSVHFDKIPASLRNATYKAYAALRYAAYQYVNEDLISANNPSNKIELEANFAPDLKSVNVSVDAPLLSAEFNNVRLNRFVTPLVVMHPEYSPLQMYAQEAFRGQQFPTCVVDNNQAQTFDNKSYPIKLGKCWHAMFHYTPKDDPTSNSASNEDDDDQISVLVRDASSSNEKEMMVVIEGYAIQMQPTSGNSPANVKVNGQQTSVSKNRLTSLDDQDGETYAQLYATPAGEIRFYAPQQDIEIQYDGTAIKLKAKNSYRSEVRGLCGTFNTQPEDDFTTPQDCVLQNPFEFAASYALDDSSCQGPAKEMKQRAQQKVSNGQCYRDVVIYGNVVADEQAESPNSHHRNSNRNTNRDSNWDSNRDSNRNSNRDSNRKSDKGNHYQSQKYSQCSTKSIQVIERNGKDCFSVHPQLDCSDECKPQGSVEKQVEFVCLQPSSTTEHFKTMINRGANPDFSQKKPIQTFKINVPESCKKPSTF